MTNITKIFLVLNSGSSSEKFSLYEGEDEVCSLYFEGVEDAGKKKFSVPSRVPMAVKSS